MLNIFATLRGFFRECLIGLAGEKVDNDETTEPWIAVATTESEMQRVRAILAEIERGEALAEFTSEPQREHDGS